MMTAQGNNDPTKSGGSGEGGDFFSWRIEPMPMAMIDQPLDFIFAEHHRQREAATILLQISHGEFDRLGVKELIEFLEVDFARHIGDEEVALFPLLRAHCLAEDNVDAVINRLADEHREDESSGMTVVAILTSLLAGQSLSLDDKRQLKVFAEHIQQHIALENGVLLPIARVRLQFAQLEMLSEMLKQRRAPM